MPDTPDIPVSRIGFRAYGSKVELMFLPDFVISLSCFSQRNILLMYLLFFFCFLIFFITLLDKLARDALDFFEALDLLDPFENLE